MISSARCASSTASALRVVNANNRARSAPASARYAVLQRGEEKVVLRQKRSARTRRASVPNAHCPRQSSLYSVSLGSSRHRCDTRAAREFRLRTHRRRRGRAKQRHDELTEAATLLEVWIA